MMGYGVVIILFKDGSTDTLDPVWESDVKEINEQLIIDHANRQQYTYDLGIVHKWAWWRLAE